MIWGLARKKPITVRYREVRTNEEGVETLEGYKPCRPEQHFIIMGVNGEEYPISKEIFRKTYTILTYPRPIKNEGGEGDP